MVMLPVAIYFKHNDYPFGNPEAVLIMTMVLLAGLFWGVMMNVGRQVGPPGGDGVSGGAGR